MGAIGITVTTAEHSRKLGFRPRGMCFGLSSWVDGPVGFAPMGRSYKKAAYGWMG